MGRFVSPATVARALLLQKGVMDAMSGIHAATKKVAESMLDVGDTKAGWEDGLKLGSVQYKRGPRTVKVVDRTELVAWLSEHRPDMLHIPESPDDLHAALLADDEGHADAAQELLIRRAAWRYLGVMKNDPSQPTVRSASEKALKDAVLADGGLLDRETGEVIPVPGLEVVEGVPTVAVTTDKDNLPSIISSLLERSGLKVVEA
jgi:hypothetical protein